MNKRQRKSRKKLIRHNRRQKKSRKNCRKKLPRKRLKPTKKRRTKEKKLILNLKRKSHLQEFLVKKKKLDPNAVPLDEDGNPMVKREVIM